MLVTPQAAKRTVSSASFDSMVIKAARSAENINSAHSTSNGLKGHSKDSIIRKESSSSLQIPGLYLQLPEYKEAHFYNDFVNFLQDY